MINTYKSFLNYQFLTQINYFYYQKFSPNKNNLPDFLQMYSSLDIADFKNMIINDISNTKNLYVLKFQPDNDITRQISVKYYTTPHEEIKQIKNLDLYCFDHGANLSIIYINQSDELISGYLLKFDNAFIICKNIDDVESQKTTTIPYLDRTESKSKIFTQTKTNLESIRSIIYHTVLNDYFYLPVSLRNQQFHLNFSIKNIQLIYNNNRMILEYTHPMKNKTFKKYEIMILNGYNIERNFYQYILFFQEINEDKKKESQTTTKFSSFVDTKKNETTEDLKKNYIELIKNNIFQAGIISFIDQYYLDKRNQDMLIKFLVDISKENNIDYITTFSEDILFEINNMLQMNLTKYFKLFDSMEKSEDIKNKKENIISHNFTKEFENIKSYVIKNKEEGYISLQEQLPFKHIEILNYNNEESKYYLKLNNLDILYNFTIIKIDKRNTILVLEKTNKIFRKTDTDYNILFTKTI